MPQQIAKPNERNPYISSEWPKRVHKKIDAYVGLVYLGSSNAYKTLDKARNGFAFRSGYPIDQITVRYSR